MRDNKGRFMSKGIVIPVPTFSTLINFLFMVIILTPWIYFGTRLNLVGRFGNLLAFIFDDAYCIKNSKTPNGEY